MSDKLNEITEGSFLRVNEQGKAYWGQSEGGGGGVQMVTITAVSDGSGNFTYTSSHTGSKINEMAQKGIVMAKVIMNDVMQALCTYNGSFDNMATFAFGSIFNKKGTLNLISVMPDTTAAEMATIT